jgi:hypothetical protein
VCGLGTSEEEGSPQMFIIYIIRIYACINRPIKCRRDQVSGVCRTHGRDGFLSDNQNGQCCLGDLGTGANAYKTYSVGCVEIAQVAGSYELHSKPSGFVNTGKLCKAYKI